MGQPKISLDEERRLLVERVTALAQLILDEWATMSWQVALERSREIERADRRIAAIDRARKRQGRTA